MQARQPGQGGTSKRRTPAPWALLLAFGQLVCAPVDAGAEPLGSGPPAGYQRGFFIRSEDESSELRLGLVSQVRYVHSHLREGGAAAGQADGTAGGFQLRRIQVDLQGHFISPRWTFRLRLDSGNGGAVSAAYAWAGYQLTDQLGPAWAR